MPDRSARRVLDAWTERLQPVQTERARAWWDVNTAASPANSARYKKALEAVEGVGHDPAGYKRVVDAIAEGGEDPIVARALAVLRSSILPYQAPEPLRLKMVELTARVQERYSNVRGSVDGKPVSDNEISAILKSSDDEKRRKAAWDASKEVGAAVAGDVRQLVRLRNEAARAVGFSDHYAMELSRQDIEPAWLDAFLSRMDAGTAKPFAAYKASLDGRLAKRFGAAASALRPWHYEDPFFQEAPETGRPSFDRLFAGKDLVALTKRTYAPLGFDIDPVLAKSDLLPRAGKCQHAFCSHVDREGDVRVLCNNVPGERWAGTMLHEFGHAVYDRHIDRAVPYVLRTPPHMSSTEAIAMLFGRLSKDADWLSTILELSAKDAADVERTAGAAFTEGMLVFTRWVLVMARFERALYEDPERDLDGLWWDLVERFQGVRRPEGRKAPDWAAKIHIATAPVYYHSYLMGECTASQLSRKIRATSGRGLVDNPAAGAFLRETFFAPGSTRTWNDHLSAATGAPLDPSLLLADMGIAA